MQTYLFEFIYKEGTINSNLVRWMNATKTDYFYVNQVMYADIYGIGTYYRIDEEPLGNNVFEVYADTSKTEVRRGLDRLFPQKGKAITVKNPTRRARVYLPGGKSFTTDINLPSREAKVQLYNSLFKVNGAVQKPEKINIFA